MNLKNFFLPTPANNYRAYLLTNKALSLVVIALFSLNLFIGNITLTKAFALFDGQAVISSHNSERLKLGLPALKENNLLDLSAEAKGEAMLKSNCWSHYCPNGESPWDFFKQVGYVYSYAGENLAEGFNDLPGVMVAWMNSKSHRENILNPNFTQIGVAILIGDYQNIKNNVLVVVHFGTPENSFPDIAKSLQPPNSPQVLTPAVNYFSNKTYPQVSGKYNYPVNISLDGKFLATVSPQAGLFSYTVSSKQENGIHQFSIADVNNKDKTTVVSFTIDTNPPLLNITQFTTHQSGNIYSLNFFPNKSLASTVISINNNKFAGKDNVTSGVSSWTFTLPVELASKGFNIEAVDLAGNKANLVLDSNTIPQILGDKTTSSLTTNFSSAVSSLNILQIISIGIISILIFLLLMDFLIVSKANYDLKTSVRSRSHLHLPAFIILFILVLIGNIHGGI